MRTVTPVADAVVSAPASAPAPQSPTGIDRTVVTQLRMAVTCILLAVAGGFLAALHYVPGISTWLNARGAALTQLRPIHTAFASLWIFGAALAVVYHWLSTQHGGLDRGDRLRFRFHTACWIVAGAGAFVTLGLGITSGREYLDFHPAFSALFLLGWFAYAWTFLRRLRHSFWAQPIYVWFWTVGTLYFIYTFVEGHAWLLPQVFDNPVRDLQLQWKSCGTLVGSFNFLMYGALTYVAERLSGNKAYAQSPTAFWLFGVGCLNSFTNYAHHTYHLPQTASVKWVAFLVSMAELVILLKVIADITRALRAQPAPFCGRGSWLTHAKWWTGAMLLYSIIISVPNLNSIVHGTHVIVGHAMGTTIGIDTLVLLGTAWWLVGEAGGAAVRNQIDCGLQRHCVRWISGLLAVLVAWLIAAGTAHGLYRYQGLPTPEWVAASRWLLPLCGGAMGAWLVVVAVRMLRSLGRRSAA
jgi:nitric oxide reductase subunit B